MNPCVDLVCLAVFVQSMNTTTWSAIIGFLPLMHMKAHGRPTFQLSVLLSHGLIHLLPNGLRCWIHA